MSDEQRFAAIGRAVDEYVESKKKLAALVAEAETLSRKCGGVANALAQLSRANLANVASLVGVVHQDAPAFPTADSLRALARDIAGEMDRKHTLYGTLKNMGFEPKD